MVNVSTPPMPKEYTAAPEIEKIAEKLIEILKPELEGFEIRYIFNVENPRKDGREVTALARKVTGLNAYLAGNAEGFFVLEFGQPAYDELEPAQVVAVVHHELCHFGISDEGQLRIVPHDTEEFNEIAATHGSFHDGLIRFGQALIRGDSDKQSRRELIREILGN